MHASDIQVSEAAPHGESSTAKRLVFTFEDVTIDIDTSVVGGHIEIAVIKPLGSRGFERLVAHGSFRRMAHLLLASETAATMLRSATETPATKGWVRR